MNRRFQWLCLLVVVLSLPAAAATYKWVDKDGNVHYSDKPVEGAKPIELPKPTVFDAPSVPQRSAAPSAAAEPESAAGYERFAFISPKPEQAFWGTGGDVPVQLDLQPGLRPGDEIHLYFNGEPTADSPLNGTGSTLAGVVRGTHSIRAVVTNAAGDEIATAGPVTFHVKQRSIQNPQNPKRKP